MWPSCLSGRHAAPTAPRVADSTLSWDNTLRDSQIVVLSLEFLRVRYMYICKVPRNSVLIPTVEVVFLKIK